MGKHKVNLMRKVGDYKIVKTNGLYEIRKNSRKIFVSLNFVSANSFLNTCLAKEASNGNGNLI